MKGVVGIVAVCCAAAIVFQLAVSSKPCEPKQVQEDIAALEAAQGKSVDECLRQLNSSDERQRWATACELSKNRDNLYLPEVHAYLAKSKNLRDSAMNTLMRELVMQRTSRSEDEMMSLLSANPRLAPVVSANYLGSREDVPRLESWLKRHTDLRVLRAMAAHYKGSPSTLGRSLYQVAESRLKELS